MDPMIVSSPPQASSPAPVRQCDICHKPILKESSYNRHVLYCRRTRNRPRTRARACQACSSAKLKCSLQSRCQRCIDKGIECVYDSPENPPSVTRPHAVDDLQGPSITKSRWPVHDIENNTSISTELYARKDSDNHAESDLHDFNATEIMPQSLKSFFSCLPVPDMGSEGHQALATNNHYDTEVIDFRTGGLDIQSFLATDLSWSKQNEYQEGNSYALTRTTSPPEHNNGEHLSPIPKSDLFSKSTAKVVMQMLCAFPQMMLRRGTLPPFIHGHWYHGPSSTEPALPQPLLNCMGIAQIFVSRSLETKSFLWRTIQTEQRSALERTDQGKISKHDLLASIQAQLIYMLMRITDNSTTEPGLNFELLSVFQHLCEMFKRLCNQPFFQLETRNPNLSWEEWIFAESRTRIAIVWLLITQMVHIKIGVPCDSFPEFPEIPLPGPRSLWEARNCAEWQFEFDVYKSMLRTGMENVGDLISASGESEMTMNKLRLELWNSGIDNLGFLLNLGVAIM